MIHFLFSHGLNNSNNNSLHVKHTCQTPLTEQYTHTHTHTHTPCLVCEKVAVATKRTMEKMKVLLFKFKANERFK